MRRRLKTPVITRRNQNARAERAAEASLRPRSGLRQAFGLAYAAADDTTEFRDNYGACGVMSAEPTRPNPVAQ
jgi:hypothetical protein